MGTRGEALRSFLTHGTGWVCCELSNVCCITGAMDGTSTEVGGRFTFTSCVVSREVGSVSVSSVRRRLAERCTGVFSTGGSSECSNLEGVDAIFDFLGPIVVSREKGETTRVCGNESLAWLPKTWRAQVGSNPERIEKRIRYILHCSLGRSHPN